MYRRVTRFLLPVMLVVFRTVIVTWTVPHRSAFTVGPLNVCVTTRLIGLTLILAGADAIAASWATGRSRAPVATTVATRLCIALLGFRARSARRGRGGGALRPR